MINNYLKLYSNNESIFQFFTYSSKANEKWNSKDILLYFNIFKKIFSFQIK